MLEELATAKTINEKGKILYEFTDQYANKEYYNYFRSDFFNRKLYNCSASIGYDWYNSLVWLKSYNTIVACYDIVDNRLHVFGRYSITTYQHVRKFSKWLKENNYCNTYFISEINHEFVNWF